MFPQVINALPYPFKATFPLIHRTPVQYGVSPLKPRFEADKLCFGNHPLAAISWPKDTIALFRRFGLLDAAGKFEAKRLIIDAKPGVEVSEKEVKQLVIDAMDAMAMAGVNHYMPHLTNDHIGAVLRLNNGTVGKGMNTEMHQHDYSAHYICAEQCALVDALHQNAKKIIAQGVSPEQALREQSQIKANTLVLARWPLTHPGNPPETPPQFFLPHDHVEPCGRCEAWMAYDTYFDPNKTRFAYLVREPQTNLSEPSKFRLTVMQIAHRMPYLKDQSRVNLSPFHLKALQEGRLPPSDYILSEGAQAILNQHTRVKALMPVLFQKAAQAIQQYAPFKVHGTRMVGVAVLLSNGKIYSAPNFEFKERMYLPPGSLATAMGYMDISRIGVEEQLAKLQFEQTLPLPTTPKKRQSTKASPKSIPVSVTTDGLGMVKSIQFPTLVNARRQRNSGRQTIENFPEFQRNLLSALQMAQQQAKADAQKRYNSYDPINYTYTPIIPPEVVGTKTSERPFVVAVAYCTGEPMFSPPTEDITHLARNDRGGANILIATLVPGNSNNGNPQVLIKTMQEHHPYLKAPSTVRTHKATV